jgi:pyruvate dehydrogenase E2 component (dihydrolipoamide acetyltransferase)
MAIDFKLPELGENITAGDVLRVLVKPGDTLSRDQPVLELETDKATIEVPSSVTGQVRDVKVKAGDKVNVGQSILTVEEGAQAASAPPDPKRSATPTPSDSARAMPPATAEEAAGANTAAKVPSGGGLEQHVEGPKREPPADKPGKVVDINRGVRVPEPAAPEVPPAPAAPSVRRMARELGVDIAEVAGTGPSGRISVDDVKAHAKGLVEGSTGVSSAAGASVPLPDFSRWGEIERQPMRAVRRKTAEHVSAAWAAVPHVTQFDVADITALEELRKKYSKQVEGAGGNLTVTAIALKVVAVALKRYPQFNASVDMKAGEIIYKKYVNIGIAVDTDRGLLVPVIRNADQKNIVQLSIELAQLSEKARTRKITLEEMQGGCFSISNLGGIGGTYFTPIINAPEVAILGISRARWEPVHVAGGPGAGAASGDQAHFIPRLMLPLSLSYDHRVVDGADGIRFLRWVAEAFEQPFVLALNG